MKHLKFFSVTFLFLSIFSCSNSPESILSSSSSSSSQLNEVTQIINVFKNENFVSSEEALSFMANLVQNNEMTNKVITRAINENEVDNISDEALETLEEMKTINIDSINTVEELRKKLKTIVISSKLDKKSNEYKVLLLSVDATKCIAGTAVGTVTLPLIGTVSGAVVGIISGGLSGMASSC